MRRIALLIAVVGSLIAAPTAFGYAAFRTPGEAAYCGVSEGAGPLVLTCWTPNDGFTVSMTKKSTVRKRYLPGNRGLVQNAAPVLGFGKRWTAGSYVCMSLPDGLKCINQRGHGWHISRYIGYDLF